MLITFKVRFAISQSLIERVSYLAGFQCLFSWFVKIDLNKMVGKLHTVEPAMMKSNVKVAM